MVRSSGIREKLRSNVLDELARERGTKRSKGDKKESSEVKKRKGDSDQDDSSEDYDNDLAISKQLDTTITKSESNSLLSILPKPKKSSAFGPTIRIDKLLQMPERADDAQNAASIMSSSKKEVEANLASRLTDDGMIEVNVNKIVGELNTDKIKELTVEKTSTSSHVIVPRGKEKQKNQITYLAQLGKATELERKEQAAQSRVNKAAARSKYGW